MKTKQFITTNGVRIYIRGDTLGGYISINIAPARTMIGFIDHLSTLKGLHAALGRLIKERRKKKI